MPGTFRKKPRIFQLVAVAVAICTIALSACGTDEPEGSKGEGTGNGATEEIKILMSVPLTGDYAETGEDMVNGAKLAAEYINDKGGIAAGPHKGARITIQSADDELSTEASSTIASRYVDDTSIWALAGYLTSGQAQAAALVAGRADLGVFSSFSCADFLTEEIHNVAIICTSLDNIAAAATDFAFSGLGAKRVGSIAADFSLLDSYYKGIQAQVDAVDGDWATKQIYSEGTSDFSTLITNLDAANVDVILTGAYQADSGRILKQVRQTGMKQPYVDFMGEGWGETFMDTAGPAAAQDAYTFEATNVTGEGETGFTKEMRDEFQEKYGKRMQAAAMHAFDSVLLIAGALEAGAENRGELLDYAKKVTGDGLLGPLQLNDELRPVSRKGFIVKVTGTGNDDREVVATYNLHGDRTIERVDS